MKAEDIFSAIGEIDEDIIASSSEVKKPKRKIILMIGTLAACIMFAGVGALAIASYGGGVQNRNITAVPQQNSQEGASSQSSTYTGAEQYESSDTDNYDAVEDNGSAKNTTSDNTDDESSEPYYHIAIRRAAGSDRNDDAEIQDDAAAESVYQNGTDEMPDVQEDMAAESEGQDGNSEDSLFQEDIAPEESFDISEGEDIGTNTVSGTTDIYYLQDGILQSASEELSDIRTVFDEWKRLNGIGEDVQLTGTWIEYSDSSVEYSSFDGESGVTYSPGGGVFMVGVSKELENYYDTLDPVLLRVSLRNTMSSPSVMPSDCYRCDLVIGE